MNPAKRQQRLQEARQAVESGDAAGAEKICQALLRANRADAQALHVLAVMASSRADDPAAVAHLTRCVAIDPRNAIFHNDLARVHALAGRYGLAIASLERALSLQPGNTQALTDLADVLERSGQTQRAQDLLTPFIHNNTVGDDMALVAVRLLDRAGQTAEAIDMARRLLAGPSSHPSTRRFLLQLLGRLCDKTGDHRAAFEAFAEAKKTESHRFDPAAYAREIDALIKAFSADALARLPKSTRRSDVPVFIACMPRSGSTLVEQMIHAHPQAWGAGENPALHQDLVELPSALGVLTPYPQCVSALHPAAVDELATRYLHTVVPPPSRAALRVTNKHLLNYLHLGMVATLFPGARVVHIRRDRMDNGLACFMTSLSTSVMPWAGDLAHIGFAWRQYERLMAHWRSTLDIAWLDVQYEDLVDDTEAQARRLIDFCGLPWDDRCLRFWEAERVVLTPSYNQVRQPIFRTARGRWRHYEPFLGPLKNALG